MRQSSMTLSLAIVALGAVPVPVVAHHISQA